MPAFDPLRTLGLKRVHRLSNTHVPQLPSRVEKPHALNDGREGCAVLIDYHGNDQSAFAAADEVIVVHVGLGSCR